MDTAIGRRTRSAWSLGVVVVFLMAGCSTGSTTPAASSTGAVPSASSTGAVPSASVAASASPASGEPIKIGLSTAMSGALAASGEQQRDGALLALEEFNAAGGANGRPIELVVEDNACNPTEGVNAANKLIADDVLAVLDGICSSVTLASMPVIKDAGVAYVVGNATSPLIREQSGVGGNDWTFRVNPDDAAIAPAVAKYLVDNNQTSKVSIVAEDTDYGKGAAAAFGDALKALGVTVLSTDFYQQGTTDFGTVLSKIERDKPDVIGYYGLGADVENFARQYIRTGLKIPVSGKPPLDQLNAAGLLENGALDGWIGPNPQSNVMESPANQAYVAAFRAKYSKEPIIQTFEGYQQARVVADAIRRATSAERSAVRDALETTKYPSMLAPDLVMEFDDHNQVHDVIGIFKVIDSKINVVGTAQT